MAHSPVLRRKEFDRMKLKSKVSAVAGSLAVLALSISSPLALAQAAAAQTPTPAAAPTASTASAPPAQLANLSPFPPPNPKLFTSDAVSVATVNAFLTQLWGYDPARIWQVAAIQKTAAPGVTKIVVFVAQKGVANKTSGTQFFVTPDGKHAIADAVIDFGATPFAAARQTLEASADGAARGAASKNLLLVEFSDLQCPHCKDAQPTMDKLAQDFPGARIVYQSFPLVDVHPSAFKAAAYGYCVEAKSNDAFFKYAQAVFDKQDALTTPETTDQTLGAAVTAAGLDPAQVATCAATPETKAKVDASIKLAEELNVNSTPTLFVNGRPLPMTSIPYETLKTIISFQAVQDGVSTGASNAPATGATAPAAK